MCDNENNLNLFFKCVQQQLMKVKEICGASDFWDTPYCNC